MYSILDIVVDGLQKHGLQDDVKFYFGHPKIFICLGLEFYDKGMNLLNKPALF